MQYLLVSTLDKACRQFLEREDVSSLEVIDWYSSEGAQLAFMAETGLSPSSFPALAVELPQTGGLEAAWKLIDGFDSLKEANKIVDDLIKEREKAGAELPPLPPKPDYLKFLYLLSIDTTFPLEVLPYLALWAANPADLMNDQKRYLFWSKMTGVNKSYFVTDALIASIQAYAGACNVLLSPPEVNP